MRPTTSVRKNPRKKLPPRNTPDSFCRRFTPTKSSLRCVGGIFLFRGKLHFENFMSRPDVIPAFQPTPLHKQGQELRSEQTVTHIHEQHNLYLFFCALTIRKQLPRNGFERSGRGQEPSRGHKFSILENFLSIRDFTSAMRLHFRSDLVGVALVGATPLHLLSQTALPLKSPTGAFIAPRRFANAVPPQTLLIIRALRHEWNGVSCLHNFTEELSNRQEVQ